jgi:DNA-binding NarL/FixJ family response regulator
VDNLRILVADDHELVRQGVISLISSHPGWEVCGKASNGRTAVEKARELHPDVVVLDLGMPSLNGINAARLILKNNPRVKVLIFTMADDDRTVRDAFEAGARGFVLKSGAPRDLLTAIQALGSGNMFLTERIAGIILAGYLAHVQTKTNNEPPSLSPREREVLQLLAEGKSTKEAAVLLKISVKTAETHRSNLMQKLKLHSVAELVLFAVRNRVIQVTVIANDSTLGQQATVSALAS